MTRRSGGLVYGNIDDTDNRIIRIDPSMRGILAIDETVHAIHSGELFRVEQRTAGDAFDIASPMSFRISTPNTAVEIHMMILLSCSTAAVLEMWEDDGTSHYVVTGGTAITPVNHNRINASSFCGKVYTGPTITAASTGVRLLNMHLGGAFVGGELNSGAEWVLAKNTEYCVRATSLADNNEGSLTLFLHAHENLTDKD